jgi:hypothetical protein
MSKTAGFMNSEDTAILLLGVLVQMKLELLSGKRKRECAE